MGCYYNLTELLGKDANIDQFIREVQRENTNIFSSKTLTNSCSDSILILHKALEYLRSKLNE